MPALPDGGAVYAAAGLFAPAGVGGGVAMSGPAILGIALAERHMPMLNQAADLLRMRHPKITDAELLERIVYAGIVETIKSGRAEIRRRKD